MSTKRINLSALEFDAIKANLKNFLRDQPQFSDYDFEGSNMSILLDVLAFNTHYNALYMNLAVNESFLDSASKRSSVVSLAQALGYTPRSATCARGTVSFKLSGITGNPPFFTVEKGTSFYSLKDGTRYNFYLPNDVTAPNVLNTYTFTDVEVVEGQLQTQRFIYTTKNAFTINAANLDTSTMVVRVQESSATTAYEVFQQSSTYAGLDQNTPVYFVRETGSGLYEISFGDGILGKSLVPGNVINVSFSTSTGEEPNGISQLTFANGSVGNGVVTNIVVGTIINGGKNPEDIEAVRFNAPNFYASQNRAVTSADYESLILSKIPNIESVLVWGGENNNPPVYGKVFICPRSTSGNTLTYGEKQSIISTINQYKIVAVIPEVVDAERLFVEMDLVIYYDPSQTVKTQDEYRTISTTLLANYNDVELQKFNKILRKTAVIRIVEGIDQAVLSVVPRMKMRFSHIIAYNQAYNYSLSINNPITPGTLLSSAFTVLGVDDPCYIDDDGNGSLTLFTNTNSIRRDLQTIGTVDYTTGTINALNLRIQTSATPELTFRATPTSADIVSVNNRIVELDMSKFVVSVIADSTSRNRVNVGTNYTFTQDKI